MVRFPLDVTDVMDVGKTFVDEITDPKYWNPPDQPFMTSPQTKVVLYTALVGVPVAVFEAVRYTQVFRAYAWADDVVRESWLDDSIRALGGSIPKNMRHSAKKKLLAKLMLRLIPVVGVVMTVVDILLILRWIEEQLNSPLTSTTGHRGNVKKQMRSTSNKYSRRRKYARYR